MWAEIFWLFLILIIYVYVGYPLLLCALRAVRLMHPIVTGTIAPSVAVIISAYNEEKAIAGKLENSLSLDYPRDALEVIVASDGSTDGTNNIVQKYEARGVKLVALPTNQGKSAAENAAVAQSSNEILVFTDANVMLRPDALRRLVAPFADPGVGCVVGQVTYRNLGDTSISEGEGSYWRYELFLRQKENEVGNFAMGSGPIMAIRRLLFCPLDPDVGEDFVLPMQVAMAGYRVVYEPGAISEETLFQNKAGDMFRSRVRVISKDLRGLFLCRSILNPFRYPLYAWGLISHKLLRWLIPYFLLVLLFSNLFLLDQPIYKLSIIGQAVFYGLALCGWVWQRGGKAPRLLGIPFSFCVVNLAAMVGVGRFLIGKKSGRWVPMRGGNLTVDRRPGNAASRGRHSERGEPRDLPGMF